LKGVAVLQRRQKEALAVEHHYVQAAAHMQQVVLKQFDEWQSFLHLIYPNNEWNKLEQQLSIQREALISSLETQWQECLLHSQENNTVFNPYIRRDRNKKIQTKPLDKALNAYENAVERMWQEQITLLAKQTLNKIPKGSLNELRCTYLQGIQFKEQLTLNNIKSRKTKKSHQREQEHTQSYVESGLDVNGAMLHYGGGDVEKYRLPFAHSQLNRIINEISKEINRSTLPTISKQLLIQRIKKISLLQDLEQFLIDYHEQWLHSDKLVDKYRMQPVIGEIIRIYNQAGLKESDTLVQLRNSYITHGIEDLVGHLERSLAWASRENQGFWYWLERSAAKTAAHQLLNACAEIKKATDSSTRKMAIKQLYKLLIQHQANLDGMWLFSFGHENTLELIDKTIATLDTVTLVGKAEDLINRDFINECKEESYTDLMQGRIKQSLRVIEEKYHLKDSEEWLSIQDELMSILKQNKTLYSIEQLYYFLSKKSKQLDKPNSQLFKPAIELRGEIRAIWHRFSQKHPEVINESHYEVAKANVIKDELNDIAGYDAVNVTLRAGRTGFNNYYDLFIDGGESLAVLKDFRHYNSQLPRLNKEYALLKPLYKTYQTQLEQARDVQKGQIPLLQSNGPGTIKCDLFSEPQQRVVNDVLDLKRFIAGDLPKDLNDFASELQNCFLDRELLKVKNLQ
ncbi:MAG: hypothetical protein PSV35_01350, partial [bacterium]|nr:hypothetical protein [bacterium]